MPVRDLDINTLESCDDVPEAPRKKKSVILSVIGIVLLAADIIGMIIINMTFGWGKTRPDYAQNIVVILEIGCIASLVLLFVAFKFHRKNTPFKIFMCFWAVYMVWFIVAMSTGIPFV